MRQSRRASIVFIVAMAAAVLAITVVQMAGGHPAVVAGLVLAWVVAFVTGYRWLMAERGRPVSGPASYALWGLVVVIAVFAAGTLIESIAG